MQDESSHPFHRFGPYTVWLSARAQPRCVTTATVGGREFTRSTALAASADAEAADWLPRALRDGSLAGAPTPLLLLDARSLAIVAVNRAAAALGGNDPADLVGRVLTDFFAPEHAAWLARQLRDLATGPVWVETIEWSKTSPAGQSGGWVPGGHGPETFLANWSRVLDGTGQVRYLLCRMERRREPRPVPRDLAVPPFDGLSARQQEIARLVLEGMRVSTISDLLALAPSTVRNHLSAVFRKAGVHSQAQFIERFGTGLGFGGSSGDG